MTPQTAPHYLYTDVRNSVKADKAAITAMTGLLDGTIGYATDTNEFGVYSVDTNTWTWLGTGGTASRPYDLVFMNMGA